MLNPQVSDPLLQLFFQSSDVEYPQPDVAVLPTLHGESAVNVKFKRIVNAEKIRRRLPRYVFTFLMETSLPWDISRSAPRRR